MQDDGGGRVQAVQGPWTDLALHTLGWKAFQDLSAHVCEEVLHRPVEIYREAQDAGQDASFFSKMDVGSGQVLQGTIQCKFTSSPSHTFKLGDISAELGNIAKLVADGHASFYVLITNMSVDGATAAKLKLKLKELGVRYPHIFGKQFLVWAIRRSARLRALVPRIYGLGDLSIILDDRKAAQTRALLKHLAPTLKVYVPTDAHVEAVKALDAHRIVLLLGAPATGKSTIAAILATLADDSEHQIFKSDGPHDLLRQWNPDGKGAFHWIDDAFGPNQMREDFVDTWVSIMPKVQAAMAGGNNFVLTSRRHIYEAAKPRLGARNHPLFRHDKAIVNVGDTTKPQREQILYNHMKGGDQPSEWKSQVKPYLSALADLSEFLPELARRLADPLYTQRLVLKRDALVAFFKEPKEHLMQVIRELSVAHQAALVLVFLHRSRLPVGRREQAMETVVLNHFGINLVALGDAVNQMTGSFLVEKSEGPETFLSFVHPTFADAITTILEESAEMIELYFLGAKIDVLMTNIVCEGASIIEDAIVLPDRFRPKLIDRLSEVPDERASNAALFSFLADRASDAVFRDAITRYSAVFERQNHHSWNILSDSKARACARALSLGVLPEVVRGRMSARLESAIVDDLDISFLEDDDLLALILPSRLLKVFVPLRAKLAEKVEVRASDIADEADLDSEPSDNFDELTDILNAIESLFENDDSMSEPLEEARGAIEEAIERVKTRQSERLEPDDDWDWRDQMPTVPVDTSRTSTNEPASSPRSMFSDVDK